MTAPPPSMIPPSSARQLAAEIADLRAAVDNIQRAGRRSQLTYSSLQNSWLNLYFGDEVRARFGQQSDGHAAVQYFGGDAPPQPSAPLVSARQLAVVVGWDGSFAGGAAAPSNLQRVDVHVSETTGFVTSPETAVVSLFGPGAVSFAGDQDAKYVRLVAVSNSQVASPPSVEVTATPLPTDFLASGVVGAEQLVADLILTSRIRMQDGGVTTLDLDGAAGSIMMSGELRTGESGERLVIPAGLPEIRAYPDTGTDYAAFHSGTEIIDAKSSGVAALRSPAHSVTGRYGHIVAHADVTTLRYVNGDGAVRAFVSAFTSGTTMSGPAVQLIASTQFQDAAPRSIRFIHTDSSGLSISNSRLYQLTAFAENRPFLASPAGNVGLVWSIPEQDLAVINYTLSGSLYRPIRASAFTIPSGRRHKTNISRSTRVMSGIVRDAPMYTWTMPGSPGRTDKDRDQNGNEIDIEIPMIPDDDSLFGPLMEDLPPDMHEADEMVNLDKKINTLWGVAREILDRLDAIEAKLPGTPQP